MGYWPHVRRGRARSAAIRNNNRAWLAPARVRAYDPGAHTKDLP